MLAGLALDKGIIASMVVEGSFNHDLFVQFLQEDLLLMMNPYPAPCSVISIDNARIHHSQEVLDLVEEFGKSYTLFQCMYAIVDAAY
ncbi:hypothetical protein BT96DRAFT_1025845 [Gymnopus androsaceus JB14]|uniref:Tc1-like transposase DDE domain-containing protein n=1 Tax=Gymnopus androsaceus JB14 TaxID=1447944 RepID=A0A6A4GQP9_9AGAR|nr:hypothetical protein BT96DRAFT_1025845 [Gymnopus androsaceus JB14]